jgi:hypothetical protein
MPITFPPPPHLGRLGVVLTVLDRSGPCTAASNLNLGPFAILQLSASHGKYIQVSSREQDAAKQTCKQQKQKRGVL